MTTDQRQVFRFHVDVLATEEQRLAIQDLIGEALCGARDDHEPPCRLAWSISYLEEDDEGALPSAEAAEIRSLLDPIEVWPQQRVDQSLNVGRPSRGGGG